VVAGPRTRHDGAIPELTFEAEALILRHARQIARPPKPQSARVLVVRQSPRGKSSAGVRQAHLTIDDRCGDGRALGNARYSQATHACYDTVN
jgi:hypothetical protein